MLFMKEKIEDNDTKLSSMIEALCIHENPESIEVLDEIGTNTSVDKIREMTCRALVRKNVHDSLSVVITQKGKGINDLSSLVAMSTINELLALADKTEAMRILEDTVNLHSEEDVRDNARSVKALLSLS